MSQDFSKSKIYKITNDYNDDFYVGATCNTLQKRFSWHKSKVLERGHLQLYNLMIEIGIERFRIDLIEDYPCQDKQALGQREGFWIRQMGTLNKVISGRDHKKYYLDNKEKIDERSKNYYENNKEKTFKRTKIYYENNKDVINESRKENFSCECGCFLIKYGLNRHQKSKKHQKLMET